MHLDVDPGAEHEVAVFALDEEAPVLVAGGHARVRLKAGALLGILKQSIGNRLLLLLDHDLVLLRFELVELRLQRVHLVGDLLERGISPGR